MTLGSSLADLARARQGRRRRASSWDRGSGNADFVGIGAGQTVARIESSHFFMNWATVILWGST